MELWALHLHVPKKGGGLLGSWALGTTGQQVIDKTVTFEDGELLKQTINGVISSICAVIYRDWNTDQQINA